VIDSLWVALATYSRLPVKQAPWTPKTLRYSLCFFPAVGVLVGVVELAWLLLAARFRLGALLTGAVGCALPVLVSGGIHLDGFMDTVDALSSRRPREEMLRILKDPSAGAFAVMGCALYLMVHAAALSRISSVRLGAALACGFILSRAISAFMMVTLPAARREGMAAGVKAAVDALYEAAGETPDQSASEAADQSAGQTTGESAGETVGQSVDEAVDEAADEAADQAAGETVGQAADERADELADEPMDRSARGPAGADACGKSAAPVIRRWAVSWAVISAALMVWAAPGRAAPALAWAAVSVVLHLRNARRFGGVTGDLAGWFVQVCELGIALALSTGG
jgi:cobalamin synthase